MWLAQGESPQLPEGLAWKGLLWSGVPCPVWGTGGPQGCFFKGAASHSTGLWGLFLYQRSSSFLLKFVVRTGFWNALGMCFFFPSSLGLTLITRWVRCSASPPGSRIFPGGSDGKDSACNVGDPGSIPGSGRSPGEGNGNPLQYSCLENPVDGGA